MSIVSICLAVLLGLAGAAQKKELAARVSKSKGDDQILQMQLFLDGSDFKPGARNALDLGKKMLPGVHVVIP